LGARVENHIRVGRRASNDQLAEDAMRHLTQCHVARPDRPAQCPDQGLGELLPVVRDGLGVAHRAAHTTEVRGVTSEVERGSGDLTPFDLARNTPDLYISDAFKSRWGRNFAAFLGCFVTQGRHRLSGRTTPRPSAPACRTSIRLNSSPLRKATHVTSRIFAGCTVGGVPSGTLRVQSRFRPLPTGLGVVVGPKG
jgi:hypothetical protein